MTQKELNKALIHNSIIQELKKEERNKDLRLLLFILLFSTIFIGFYCLKVEQYKKYINKLELQINTVK